MFLLTSFLTVFFLVSTFFLTGLSSAFRRLHKAETLKEIKGLGKLFFYGPFHRFFFPQYEYEGLFFATICAQNISRFCYAIFLVLTLAQTNFFTQAINFSNDYTLAWFQLVLTVVLFLLVALLIADYLPRILGTRFPERMIKICAPFAMPLFFLVFPLTYLFLKAARPLSQSFSLDSSQEPLGNEEIIEMLQQADLNSPFDLHHQKLIESVVCFKERIAREVMVPRVDLFSLPAETTIKAAAKLLHQEGYSRIPIYQNTVDNIVGVLMYKDVLAKYLEAEQKKNPKILDEPIEILQKPVLHIPETKKLSSLLQEFRKKQVHLAIVVDEYGGTEGIVTIEDILEEIVGEISDEYDQAEERMFYPQGDGSWVVDARMNILDVEDEMAIEIPQEGEYDTIGGYIYHVTGTIPPKGFVIHHDRFDMEILDSNERSVEQVRIKALTMENQNSENPDLGTE